MNDDWRVTIELEGEGVIGDLLEGVRAGAVGREAAKRLGDRVAVSHDDGRLRLYAASEADARAAETAIRPLLARHRLEGGPARLERWHHEEERWEDATVPLPADEAERRAEHERLMARERAESERAGVPEWEVLVTLPSPQAARELADKLEGEGVPVTRRSQHVMVGALTEDDAAALAERLRAEAPPEATLEVQGGGQAAWSALHPFAVFGGLGQ